jgi:hypothetical protein
MRDSNGTKLLGGAASVAAIGFLLTPTPAQGMPSVPLAPNGCASYQFPGGQVSLHYPNIGQAEFDTVAGGTHVDTKAVTIYPQGGDMPGTVIGDIKGDKIHLKITREGVGRTYPAMILDGQVGPDNRGHGTYTYKGGDPGSWDSIQELKCVPAAPSPSPSPQPEPEQPKPLAPESAGTRPLRPPRHRSRLLRRHRDPTKPASRTRST